MPHRLLLVEDDAALASMIVEFLGHEGYEVVTETHGAVAVERIRNEPFDAIVLDVGLPGLDGISVCKYVRSGFTGPIIILTARGEQVDEADALEVGADDFMTKPVRPRSLLARLRYQLRRSADTDPGGPASRITVNDLTIDATNRTVERCGEPVELTAAEFDLLWYLAERAGTVVERDEIYRALLEIPFDGLDRCIDQRVSRLRRKIGDDPLRPARIRSVRGIGYMLAVEP